MQALAEQVRIVRLPVNRVSQINKIKKTFTLLENKYEREPTDLEISQTLCIAPDDVIMASRNAVRHLSMDAPLAQSEDGNMYDVMLNKESVSPDKKLIRDSLVKDIDRVLLTLSPREEEIVRLYYGLGGTEVHGLEEIGFRLNLTRERVRQIKESALKRLKHTQRSNSLINHLDLSSQ
jgi:RNA polymerase primary sigma factor